MTPDPEARTAAERAVLASFARAIVANVDRAAADNAMPHMAFATAMIAACCFIAEREAGKERMLEWLEGQLAGQRADPTELNAKPN